MKALNKSQVTALFEREAILMGTDDLVPEKRAIALFGKMRLRTPEAWTEAVPADMLTGMALAIIRCLL